MKLARFEQPLERMHPLRDEMRAFARVDARVVADGFDPVDRFDVDDDRLGAGANADAFRRRLTRLGLRGDTQLAGRPPVAAIVGHAGECVLKRQRIERVQRGRRRA